MNSKIEFKINGVVPLLMHNGQLANPRNEIVKAIKEITSNRKKTDADLVELMHLEFMGGLYLNSEGKIVIPGESVEAMLKAGATKKKLGKAFTAGVICDGEWILDYDGPKDPEKLFLDENFVFTRPAKVCKARIMRTRAIFRRWSLSFVVHFNDQVVNRKDVIDAAITAGSLSGLGDWRPKFGRFEVEDMK